MDPLPPQDFKRPHWGWFALLDGSLAFLALIVTCPSLAARIRTKVPIGSSKALRLTLFGALIVHLGEGTVAWSLARKKGLPAGRWALQTTLVGFPSLLAMASLDQTNQSE